MAVNKIHFNRRQVIKGLGLAAVAPAALCLGQEKTPAKSDSQAAMRKGRPLLFKTIDTPARVGLIKGNDRRENTFQALKQIEDEVLASIGSKKILIKPNFVSITRQLSATHVDAVRGILDFLTPHYKNQIIIGESTAGRTSTMEGFKNYNYLPLEKEYNVKLIDLNTQSWKYTYVFGKGNQPLSLRMIDTFLDPDLYIISAAKLKTHDRVVTTLSIKNVLLAAPLNDYKSSDKWRTHSANTFTKDTILHYNLFHLAQMTWPDLGVIDGFVGMEDNGPVGGDPVDCRLAFASRDPLALDTLATRVMGFDPAQIMYLASFAEAGFGQGDLQKITPLGAPLDQCQFKFKPSKQAQKAYNL